MTMVRNPVVVAAGDPSLRCPEIDVVQDLVPAADYAKPGSIYGEVDLLTRAGGRVGSMRRPLVIPTA